MARGRPRVDRPHPDGCDPVLGSDGLPTPPEPFLPTGWFGWVILVAVIGCLVGGALVLTGVVA